MSEHVFPVPRVVTPIAGDPADRTMELEARVEASLPAQGYELQIGADGVRALYSDAAGLRYATQTWKQLRDAHDSGVPAQIIRDWPDFAVRGYMLDISRDRVPTRQTLERLVELLDLFRINHLELYTEHTFAYRDHEPVWRDATPLIAEDLRWLDQLCSSYGIELSVNQNCFGHMERWLRHPWYRERAEAPDGWVSKFGGQMPPAVLAPTQDNAEFAVALVRELLSHVSSRRVNIGCDETFELGTGRSKASVDEHGRGRVYFEHLKRLLEPLRREGCEVMFWGDILRSHPELIGELEGDNAIALVWHYEAPIDVALIPPPLLEIGAEFGITAEVLRGFPGQIGAFADSGFPHWVCPGTSSWNSFVGRLLNAKLNCVDAAETGLRSGASGFLITDWGDNGHLQPPSISFAPLAYGAAVSWCLASNVNLEIASVLDRLVFRDETHELGTAIEEIGNTYAGTGKVGFNGSPMFTAMMQRGMLGSLGEVDPPSLSHVLQVLDAAEQRVGRSQPSCSDGPIIKRELVQAIRLARHGAWRLAREAGLVCPDDATLRSDLEQLIAEQRACWLMRSRAGGLEDSLARLGRTLATYA